MESIPLMGEMHPIVLQDIARSSNTHEEHKQIAISSSRGTLHPPQNRATRQGNDTTSYEIIYFLLPTSETYFGAIL